MANNEVNLEELRKKRQEARQRLGNNKSNKKNFNILAAILFVFSIISFITVSQLSSDISPAIKTSLPKNGGTVGPVEIKKDNSVCIVKSYQDVGVNQSSYVAGNVLDKNKELLFGFGKDVWNEEGYDDEGYWHETENNYETKITFPIKGKYYFEFESEPTETNQTSDIYVEITQKQASTLIFEWFGWLGLIAAGILFVLANPQLFDGDD